MRLVAENLSGERGDTIIFEGISFALDAGEGMVVTGPNGAGKSTLLRVIAGFLPASQGAVYLDSGDIAASSHYLGPSNAMKPVLTVAENLSFWQNFYGGGSVSPLEALGRVALPHVLDVPFSDLSTGQKRRVAIARLFVCERKLWILDEPTSGLDALAEKNFALLIDAHLKSGGIVIAATHLPIDVDGMKELSFSGGVQ